MIKMKKLKLNFKILVKVTEEDNLLCKIIKKINSNNNWNKTKNMKQNL